MKILRDENFPLPLCHRLRNAAFDAERIIQLGQRGMSDERIRGRLVAEPATLRRSAGATAARSLTSELHGPPGRSRRMLTA